MQTRYVIDEELNDNLRDSRHQLLFETDLET